MDAIMTLTQVTPSSSSSQKKLLLAAETAPFCPDPALFPAFGAAPTSAKPQSPPQPQDPQQTCEDRTSASMGACYPKCMDVGEEQLLLPGLQAKRSADSAMDATPYEEELLVAKMRTFDLEELGLAAQHAQQKQVEKCIVVDYEDSDGEHPQLDQEATCAPSACGPLTGVAPAPTTGSLRGKSVIFQQEAEPASSSSTESDEEPRCSKVHKLCTCEVKLHCSLESCWLVSRGQVYDVTGLVTSHPGGVRSILRKAGGPDCARDMKFHTKKARKMMEKCFIGKLQQCGDDVECAGEANCSIM